RERKDPPRAPQRRVERTFADRNPDGPAMRGSRVGVDERLSVERAVADDALGAPAHLVAPRRARGLAGLLAVGIEQARDERAVAVDDTCVPVGRIMLLAQQGAESARVEPDRNDVERHAVAKYGCIDRRNRPSRPASDENVRQLRLAGRESASLQL